MGGQTMTTHILFEVCPNCNDPNADIVFRVFSRDECECLGCGHKWPPLKMIIPEKDHVIKIIDERTTIDNDWWTDMIKDNK